MTTVIIIILIIVCIILGYQLSKKVQVDKTIYQRNEELKKANELEEQFCQKLKYDVASLSSEYNHLDEDKNRLINELNDLRSNISNTLDENKKISDSAFRDYEKTLEQAYVATELSFDKRVELLNSEMKSIQEDLDNLKATRAAAHEALLKEQEVKDNKNNYRLLPSQADLTDARRLEIVKRELNKPRILSMLIWQTYWQPLAKKQFPQILQDKTKCGIYKITNTITDECYIGQSVDVYKRWCEHCKCGLGIDTPPGNKLYKAIQEYGLENFTFELLTECTQSELNEKERYFIELYQADTFGYNSNKGVQ